jgi:hypothetical protein
MLVFSEILQRIYPLVLFAFSIFQTGAKMAPPQVTQRAETSSADQPISVVIRTDHEKYSMADTMKLDVSLQNTGDATIYVDRRIFCCGIGSGRELQVRDEQGKRVSLRVPTEEIMPPPKEEDTSILIRLDQGFFYGTGLDIPVKDHFPKAGKYSIRVIYKSWLRKEFVAPQLRDLPALWADKPQIASEPVWIEVTQ